MNYEQECAMKRLLKIANTDSGQGGKVASFLLSWWNASNCGGFDLTDLWSVDKAIADDMMVIIHFIYENHAVYPSEFGYRPQMLELIKVWRDHLISNQ